MNGRSIETWHTRRKIQAKVELRSSWELSSSQSNAEPTGSTARLWRRRRRRPLQMDRWTRHLRAASAERCSKLPLARPHFRSADRQATLTSLWPLQIRQDSDRCAANPAAHFASTKVWKMPHFTFTFKLKLKVQSCYLNVRQVDIGIEKIGISRVPDQILDFFLGFVEYVSIEGRLVGNAVVYLFANQFRHVDLPWPNVFSMDKIDYLDARSRIFRPLALQTLAGEPKLKPQHCH